MKTISIFLADDEPHVRMYLRTILKSSHYPVEIVAEASNGDQAIAGYSKLRPDILLMDISMPQRTGLEALDVIRDKFPDANIVMLTSITDQQSIKDALKRGAASYIRKDTPIEQIKVALERVFSRVAGNDPLSQEDDGHDAEV